MYEPLSFRKPLSFGLAAALVAAQVVPVSLPGLTAIGAAPAQAQQYQTISCYSRGNAPNSCPLPRGTTSVSFVGPDRSMRCQENRTWAKQGNRLLVSGGCGGNFEVTIGEQGGGQGPGWGGGNQGGGWGGGNQQGFAGQISCNSDNNRPRQCNANTQNRVVMLQQTSQAPCVEGQTWTYNNRRITVRDGCSARFAYGYGNQGGNWGGGGGWQGGNQQGFAGQIDCNSDDNRTRQCNANTQNRVVMLQQTSRAACIEGQTWSYDNRRITVRDGCSARFAYGYGNQDGNWGGGGGWQGGNQGGNQGFAGQTECRSENNRYQRCSANTQSRAVLLRQFSNTQCVEGRNWGYDRQSIWVNSGCQGRFGYGYGNLQGDISSGSSSGGGSNAGAVIGGAAIAAGLIAILSQAGKSSAPKATNTTATLDASMAKFPSAAQAEGKACMDEAARQIAATGGTRVRLDTVDRAERSGNGWMIIARLTATYDDHTQPMTMDCRASGSNVTAFDVR